MPTCLDCGEPLDSRTVLYHPGCCPHSKIQPDDDGLADRFLVCIACNQRVHATTNEDGDISWEID